MSEEVREARKRKLRGHLCRLYPTAEQAARLGQWMGAVRCVYNLALEQRETFGRPGRPIGWVAQCRELKDLRAEFEWLRDVPANPLHQALRDLEQAYVNWRRGGARRPTFRRKGGRAGLRFPVTDGVRVTPAGRLGKVRLHRIGEIRVRLSRPLVGELRSLTVTERAGRWYVSALCAEETEEPVAARGSAVGIDRGITVFAALSSGELIGGPHVGRRAGASLARAQRNLARKVKGSSNRRKARLRVARLQLRVSDARKDFLHKTSTAIAKSHGVVLLEDLKVRNMTASARGTVEAPGRNVRQKAGLNRAILDQGWGLFRTMLAYKLEERGGFLLTVNPRDTSRTCSECGVVDADSREGVRFSCRSCGHDAHADTNAAINILRRGAPSMPAEAALAAAETGTGLGRMPICEGDGLFSHQSTGRKR